MMSFVEFMNALEEFKKHKISYSPLWFVEVSLLDDVYSSITSDGCFYTLKDYLKHVRLPFLIFKCNYLSMIITFHNYGAMLGHDSGYNIEKIRASYNKIVKKLMDYEKQKGIKRYSLHERIAIEEKHVNKKLIELEKTKIVELKQKELKKAKTERRKARKFANTKNKDLIK